jgi:protein TonB
MSLIAPTTALLLLGALPVPVQLEPALPRIRLPGNVQKRKLYYAPEPVYPPKAREARIQGVVRFSALISADGAVHRLRLVSGHPLLVAPAQEAVKQWRYRPTYLNGTPAEVLTEIEVHFRLDRSNSPPGTLRPAEASKQEGERAAVA